MSRLTIHNIETAPAEAKDRITLVAKNNGFIPNLIGVLANAPTALQMYQEVGKLNASGSLNPAEIEVIQITAASNNGCDFCVAGHSAISLKKNLIPENVVKALQRLENFAHADRKLNALAEFTLAVMRHKGAVSDDDLKSFFAAGYNQQQAVETIVGVALATLCNYTNNLAKTDINPELKPYAP